MRATYSRAVPIHLLVAEDDRNHAEILRRYLESAGYRTTITHDGRTAWEQFRRLRPDLVVLDVMMPELDGLTVCTLLRRESDVPVLMLTARTSEDDLLTGLDRGADDYLTKPYRPRELLARIHALLRRAAPAPDEYGPFAIDVARRAFTVHGRAVDCTPGEFAILTALMRQPERVFTRANLMEHTNGYGRDSTERTIDTHVSNLRRKIEPNPRRPRYLVTVYSAGYKLIDPGPP